MVTKAQIKKIQSLRYKKYRIQNGLFVAEGPKMIQEIQHTNYKIHSIYCTSEGKSQIPALISGELIELTSEKELAKISFMEAPQQIVSIVELPSTEFDKKAFEDNWLLAIDGLQNPGNLGTIIRTADWFGIKNIVCSLETVDAFNPKVVQATMGSLFHSNIYYTDLRSFLQASDHSVYGLTIQGRDIHHCNMASKGILVVGHETKGIEEDLRGYIDKELMIPKYGRAESLNASIAAAIAMDQLRAKEEKART